MKQLVYVLMYLAAIAAANLSVTHWGARVSVLTAFLFIGLDLTTRDALHDLWSRHRWLKLGALIVTGSALSYLVNPNSGRIALASCAAFALSAAVDAIGYHLLRRRPWYERANVSNVPSAAVDSLVFPALAFPGPLMLSIVFGQFCAKVAGGFVWSAVLGWRRRLFAVAT